MYGGYMYEGDMYGGDMYEGKNESTDTSQQANSEFRADTAKQADQIMRPSADKSAVEDLQVSAISHLINVIRRLRAKDGCPWDRAQTHESLKPPCIEEAAEVVCGINILTETGDAENLKEELGDLLLQIVYHTCIAEEEGLFTFDDVAQTAADKMVRRHPHVFAGVKYRSDEEKQASWEAIKKMEKQGREWQQPYLEAAMRESKELIDVAMKRKGFEK